MQRALSSSEPLVGHQCLVAEVSCDPLCSLVELNSLRLHRSSAYCMKDCNERSNFQLL